MTCRRVDRAVKVRGHPRRAFGLCLHRPGAGVFACSSKFEIADGRDVRRAEHREQVLGTAEAKAWNGAAGAGGEDRRLTVLFFRTLQTTNGQSGEEKEEPREAEEAGEEEGAPAKDNNGCALVCDVVRGFAQSLDIQRP